jgi:hypothetical protein
MLVAKGLGLQRDLTSASAAWVPAQDRDDGGLLQLSLSGLTGRSSTPRPLDSLSGGSEYWITRSSRAMTTESAARPLSRHCERSEAIHLATRRDERWIASSQGLLAMTARHTSTERHTSAFSRREAPEVCVNVSPKKSEGVGNAGRRCTRSLVCKVESTRV